MPKYLLRLPVISLVSSACSKHWLSARDEPFIVGTVTSGIPSPTLGKNIAMGYVKSGWHKKGTEVEVEVRNKRQKAVLTPMPFTKTNYWRG